MRPLAQTFVVALCAFVAAGCGGAGEPAATSAAASAEAGAPETPSARERVPVIEGTSVEGEPISLADYRGQAVLVNVWSSW